MESSKDLVPLSANELASFETPAPSAVKILPVQWSIEKYNVAQELALSGKTKTKISKDLKIPIAIINKWLESKEFTEYINSIVMEYAKASKAERLRLLMKALKAKEDLAELDGYDTFSRKDPLDIIAEIRKETGEDKGSGQSNYTSLLENLLKHSITNQQPIIQVGSGTQNDQM